MTSKHIVMFSMTPLFRDKVMGGAQKQLYVVALHLAGLGHRVTVLCTRRAPDVLAPFDWHPNARVVPIFRFKQPYPEPYATPIFNLATATQDLAKYLATADVFYSHDGGFVFSYVYGQIPTVVSLRSIIFSETLQSAFLFQGDDLLLISQHQRDTLLQTVGQFFPSLPARTHVVYNGLNFDTFQSTDPAPVLNLIPQVNPAEHAIALFPHRPEADKGILQVIEVARRLVVEHRIHNLRVLVPRWMEAALSPADRAFYDDLLAQLDAYGLREHFVFHEWVPQSLMPAYYSLGHLTFAIGSYVETFGNVPYESLACGTPAIVAAVGPARELLPANLIHRIPYGDSAQAAQIAAPLLHTRTRTSPQTLDYLRAHFEVSQMVNHYAQIILNAEKRPPLTYAHTPLSPQRLFTVPAWVHRTGSRAYHDLTATWTQDAATLNALDILTQSPERRAPAEQLAEWERLYRDGWIVPAPPALHSVYLSLGSNHNAHANLRALLTELRAHPAVSVQAVSGIYASPDAHNNSEPYLNAAVLLTTPLTPAALKTDVLRPLETKLGRDRSQKRHVSADIDIMLWDYAVSTYLDKPIPDPAVTTQPFVALPLAEIAPAYVHPQTGQSLAQIAAALPQQNIQRTGAL